jgi:16S rRNA (guanine527-N7)-methyltransferase
MTNEDSAAAIASLAGAVSRAQEEHLARYVELLRESGARQNLMSSEGLERAEEHVVDCAALLQIVELPGSPVGDLGSGAGLPGIVLSILRPRQRFVLVDSRRSKIVFLKRAARELGLGNVEVVHERLEMLRGRISFDLAVSRALGSIRRSLEPSLELLAAGGRLVLYKGPGWGDERESATRVAAACGAELESESRVALPGLDRTTTFVTFRRAK